MRPKYGDLVITKDIDLIGTKVGDSLMRGLPLEELKRYSIGIFMGEKQAIGLVMFKDGFHWVDTSWLSVLS